MTKYRHQPTPAARLMESGSGALSDLELIATLTGSLQAASALLDKYRSLTSILAADPAELIAVPGIGDVAAARIASTREIAYRAVRERCADRSIAGPDDIYDVLAPEMQGLAQESFRVLLLNHRKRLIRIEEVFRGTGNECFANPAETLRLAISYSAHSIAIAHNHPSGDPSPSQSDHHATRRMESACKAVGLPLVDHVIIGRPGSPSQQPFFSFKEAGIL